MSGYVNNEFIEELHEVLWDSDEYDWIHVLWNDKIKDLVIKYIQPPIDFSFLESGPETEEIKDPDFVIEALSKLRGILLEHKNDFPYLYSFALNNGKDDSHLQIYYNNRVYRLRSGLDFCDMLGENTWSQFFKLMVTFKNYKEENERIDKSNTIDLRDKNEIHGIELDEKWDRCNGWFRSRKKGNDIVVKIVKLSIYDYSLKGIERTIAFCQKAKSMNAMVSFGIS